jgi:tRNA (guanine37-N1)-methyltransferase
MRKNWQASILTLFPEMFPGTLGYSLAGSALAKELWSLNVINIRDFSTDKRGTVDDYPYGGGTGMVLKPDVLGLAIENVLSINNIDNLIYMSPRGRLLDQKKSLELSQKQHIAIICGRFEGIDQRVIDKFNIEEISIGDYILSGGEIAALTLLDSCVRLLPGVIENKDALSEESFNPDGEFANLLEYPHYTKPREWKDVTVPEILLSGNHAKIKEWRLKQAKQITKQRRLDLWDKYNKKEV